MRRTCEAKPPKAGKQKKKKQQTTAQCEWHAEEDSMRITEATTCLREEETTNNGPMRITCEREQHANNNSNIWQREEETTNNAQCELKAKTDASPRSKRSRGV